jgi:diguanylate cyclase (GGDEF)-like protein
MPTTADVEDEQRQRARGASISDVATEVSVYDSLVSIDAVGPHITVLAAAPANIVDGGTTHTVKATTLLPANVPVGGYSDDQGLRQTSAAVAGAANVFVSAVAPADVNLPGEEFRFYVIIFSLAVLLLLLAGVTLVVEQRSLLERASFDSLTKLPNRGEFERRAADVLATADRDESGVCLLLFDLNGFKQVNDTHGHIVGDEVLKVVGARLRKAVRDGDVVARWGGDEFVVVMPGISTPEMGSRRALQLAEQVGGRTRLDGVEVALRVKVSVGVSIWPEHGERLDELVLAADQAMYEAKREGVTCKVAAQSPPQPSLVHTHA